jgi:ferredoxin
LLAQLFEQEISRRKALATGVIRAERVRCVQCRICSYSCPVGLDVRRLVREASPISHNNCLTRGQCVARCPRGVLSLESIPTLE